MSRKRSEEISINNSLARDHAERMRRKAELFNDADQPESATHQGYGAITDAETCYVNTIRLIPTLRENLVADCNNLVKVADEWHNNDKEIARHLTVKYEGNGSSAML